jgi:hypothetical protein
MQKGNLGEDEAKEFWAKKKDDGQYIAVSDICGYCWMFSLIVVRKLGKLATAMNKIAPA